MLAERRFQRARPPRKIPNNARIRIPAFAQNGRGNLADGMYPPVGGTTRGGNLPARSSPSQNSGCAQSGILGEVLFPGQPGTVPPNGISGVFPVCTPFTYDQWKRELKLWI